MFQAMGEQIHQILDVTIVYPGGAKNIWEFHCAAVNEVMVRVKSYPVEKDLLGDYFSDQEYRKRIQTWLNTLWEEKDEYIDRLRR